MHLQNKDIVIENNSKSFMERSSNFLLILNLLVFLKKIIVRNFYQFRLYLQQFFHPCIFC